MNRVFIVAEAGVNHNGSLRVAKKMIEVAAAAGCDAIKFQTFRAENIVTKNASKTRYQIDNTDAGESQYEMLKKLELSPANHEELFSFCLKKKIMFMSTPFDEKSVDLLDNLGVRMFKV
ncbi:MAG: pseudaminic acid synthase, partial [Omnitrophica WOR_2 bacterium SM23_29]